MGLGGAAVSQTPAVPSQPVTPCPALGYFRNCYGTYTWFDGSTYEGAWKDNQKTGLATYKDANGDSYVGEWKNNRRSGEGIYSWSDGRVWMGEWREGEPHGKFIQYAPDKSVERMGIFQKGKFHSSRLVEPKLFTRIRLFIEPPPVASPAATTVVKEEPAVSNQAAVLPATTSVAPAVPPVAASAVAQAPSPAPHAATSLIPNPSANAGRTRAAAAVERLRAGSQIDEVFPPP